MRSGTESGMEAGGLVYCEKVSVIVWNSPHDRDPRLPVDDRAERDLLILLHDGRITTKRTALIGEAELGRMTAWAELPAPSEATLDDLHYAIESAEDNRMTRRPSAVLRVARLRALLPEETGQELIITDLEDDMPYDIYGEPLETGHCEVHPWVHMEYPCPVCLREHEEAERARQAEDAMYRKMAEEQSAQERAAYDAEFPDTDNPYDRGDDLGT